MLTRVYFLMFGQVIVAYEGFPTNITLIPLVIMVDSEMKPVQANIENYSYKNGILIIESLKLLSSSSLSKSHWTHL